jgi:hypothetical protein
MIQSSEEVEEKVLVECENCDIEVEEYHAHSLCAECYHEVYVSCCNCGEEVYQEESYYSSNSSDYYCGDCYFEVYTSCYECEEEVEIQPSGIMKNPIVNIMYQTLLIA